MAGCLQPSFPKPVPGSGSLRSLTLPLMRLSQSLFPALAGRGRGGRKKGHGDDVEEESHVHNRMALLCKYGRQTCRRLASESPPSALSHARAWRGLRGGSSVLKSEWQPGSRRSLRKAPIWTTRSTILWHPDHLASAVTTCTCGNDSQ